MKEKISSILKKERHLPIPEWLKQSRLAFMLHDLPKKNEAQTAVRTLGPKEKIFFWIFAVIFLISSLNIIWRINQDYMVEIPAEGGQLIEGIPDIPRFVNPLFATGEADRDLTALVYSGLLRARDGNYIPDLAEKLPEISDDGLKYTFKIRENAVWHDGVPVTAEDIKFTIDKARDPVLKSPKRPNWEGVNIEVVDGKTISFTLKQPYSLFLENATMGILPKHKWGNIDSGVLMFSELNIKGVGTGPYKIKKFYRNSGNGIPEYAEFVPFSDFTLGKPKISKIIIRFYPNQESLQNAFNNGDIQGMNSISPLSAENIKKQGGRIEEESLPRVLGVFYNQNQSKILADFSVRKALDRSIDRKRIVDTVLLGYGTVIKQPIPPELIKIGNKESDNGSASSTENINAAKEILSKNEWKLNEKTGRLEKKTKKETLALELSLATSNFPELKKAAEMIKEDWEKIGVKVALQVYEKGDLDRNAIDPRKYDALFFGEIIGRDIDLYPFWHSSQRKSPGVNIALYANSKADKILESLNNLRPDPANMSKKLKLYNDFQNEVSVDIPASFVYSPHFLYTIPKDIKGMKLIPLNTSADRFLNIYEWYIDTEKIWKVFQ